VFGLHANADITWVFSVFVIFHCYVHMLLLFLKTVSLGIN
jgi:hypothetical protein